MQVENNVAKAEQPTQPSSLERTFRESYKMIHELQLQVFKNYLIHGTLDTDFAVKEYAGLLHEDKPKKKIHLKALKKEIVDILIYVSALSGFIFESEDELIQIMREKVEENKTRTDWAIERG